LYRGKKKTAKEKEKKLLSFLLLPFVLCFFVLTTQAELYKEKKS